MIEHCIALLIERKPIANTRELVKLARLAGLQPSIDYTDFKTLYDVAEFALNKLLISSISPDHQINTNTIINDLRALSKLLPKETERSVDQSIYQQFSTPLETGYRMAALLDINSNDILLEPSAGTGNLAAVCKLFQPKAIHVNELHKGRFNLLTNLTCFSPSNEDATQLGNLSKMQGLGITKCIMNPPFTRHSNTQSKIDHLAGAKHIASSYQLIVPGGKLCVLINSSFAPGSRGREHFLSLSQGAQIMEELPLDSQTFNRKGTNTNTSILLIQKDTMADKPTLPASFSEARKLI